MDSEAFSLRTVYACEKFPGRVSKTLYLAGPRVLDTTKSWRVAALAWLERRRFDGHVFVPEPRPLSTPADNEHGTTLLSSDSASTSAPTTPRRRLHSVAKHRHDYNDSVTAPNDYARLDVERLMAWEHQCMRSCDILLFWFERRAGGNQCLELNDDYGLYKSSGRLIVLGVAPHSHRVEYQLQYARQHRFPICRTLEEALGKCVSMLHRFSQVHTPASIARQGSMAHVPVYVYTWRPFQQWLEQTRVNQNHIQRCVLDTCTRVLSTTTGGGDCSVNGKDTETLIRQRREQPSLVHARLHVGVQFDMGDKVMRTQTIDVHAPEYYIFAYYIPTRVRRESKQTLRDAEIVLKYYFRCSMNSLSGMDPCLQLVHAVYDDAASSSAPLQMESVAATWRQQTGQRLCVASTRLRGLEFSGSEMQSDVNMSTRRCVLYTLELSERECEELRIVDSVEHQVILFEYSSLQYQQLDWKTVGMIELGMRNIQLRWRQAWLSKREEAADGADVDDTDDFDTSASTASSSRSSSIHDQDDAE